MDDDYEQDFEEEVVEEDIPDGRDDSPPKGKQNSKRYQNDIDDDIEYKHDNKSQMRSNLSGKNPSSISSAKVRKTIQAKPINHTGGNITPKAIERIGGNAKKKKDDIDEDSPLVKPSRTPSEGKYMQKVVEQMDFDVSKSVTKSKQSMAYDRVAVSINSFGGYYEQYRELLENQKIFRSEREIEKENDVIRGYLKDMNVQLTKMVENSSVASFVPKKITEFKHKPIEEKEKVISRELYNNEKILENSAEEFHKLKARIDTIKDPSYLINIDDQIEELRRKADKIRKANVKLNVATAFAGRDLNDIESEGIHPQVKEINQKGQELVIVKKKLDKLYSENEAFEEQKTKKNERLDELAERLDKLSTIASHMKITTPNIQKVEKHAALKKQVTDLENGIKFLENNNDKYIRNHLQKEVDELTIVYNRDKEHITLLEDMLGQQKNALKEMLEKENMKDKNDKATRELISKIKLTLEEAENPYEFNTNMDQHTTTSAAAEDRGRKGGKPPIGKDPRKDLYDGLPLYSPNKLKAEAAKKVPNKKDFPIDIREKTPEVQAREVPKKVEKVTEKKAPVVEPKQLSRPSSHKEIKEAVGKPREKEVPKEEEKPKEDSNPTFSKPTIFKKPFAKKVEDSATGEDLMKKEESAPVLLNKPEVKQEPISLSKDNKNNGLSLPDFLQDTKKSPEVTKKNELKISDDANKKPNNDLQAPGNSKLITDIPVDESINLGGVSRVRGGRQRGGEQPKKDDLWNSNDLKLNDSNADSNRIQANNAKPIADPFAKFDNPDKDFTSKRVSGGAVEKKPEPKKNDDFDSMGLFNPVEEKKPVVQEPKKEASLFGGDDDLGRIQVRKGPRDRGGIGGLGGGIGGGLGGGLGANNKENIDDLFGSGGNKETLTLDSKPTRPRNGFADDKKKDDDLFGDDLFTKKTTIEPKKTEQLTLDNPIKNNNDGFSLKNDGGFSNKKEDLLGLKSDFVEPAQEKPAQKFSMAPDNNLGGIGGKPRRMNMNMGGNANPQKDLAKKAEQGGGGFFDEMDV